jgi:hypothetical protein
MSKAPKEGLCSDSLITHTIGLISANRIVTASEPLGKIDALQMGRDSTVLMAVVQWVSFLYRIRCG